MFRIFPSFEKPVERDRYVNIQPQGRDFRGIGIVLFLAAGCGVTLALWEPSHQVTTPFVTGSVTPAATAPGTATKAVETTAAAADSDDDDAPTVKLSQFCSQRTTARRDCATARAFKEARLTAPETAPAKPDPVVEKVTAAPADTASIMAEETAPQPAARPQKQAAPKLRQRAQDNGAVQRLVKVYDQVLPDGRRVPVYRRVGSNGGYETGTIVDGEYRPARRANLDQAAGSRNYGMQ